MFFRLFSLLCTVVISLPAFAGEITVNNAWIAEAPPVSRVHAGYFTLHNGGSKPVTLKTVSSEMYGNIEMHLSIEKDGVSSMQWLQQIEIPAGEDFAFAPGGYHLMLFRPVKRLKQGDEVKLHFGFADGSRITTTATVKKR